MYPDLLFYYNVDLTDVIAGRGPHPRLVLAMVQRLPDTSLTAALLQGGREYFGWGVDRHMAADTYDALNVQTQATGNWRKPPKFPLWPRPGVKQAKSSETAKKVSVKDLYNKFATGGTNRR